MVTRHWRPGLHRSADRLHGRHCVDSVRGEPKIFRIIGEVWLGPSRATFATGDDRRGLVVHRLDLDGVDGCTGSNSLDCRSHLFRTVWYGNGSRVLELLQLSHRLVPSLRGLGLGCQLRVAIAVS